MPGRVTWIDMKKKMETQTSQTRKHLENEGPDIDWISTVFSLPKFDHVFWRLSDGIQLSWRQISSNSLANQHTLNTLTDLKCCCILAASFCIEVASGSSCHSACLGRHTSHCLPSQKPGPLCFVAPGGSCNPLRMEAFGMFIIGVFDESAGHLGLKSGHKLVFVLMRCHKGG